MVFYLLLLIDFYIVPWFIKNTGSAMIVMLVIIPLICLITSVFYGIRNGFNFWYILIVAIMFAPSIFIFYNSSAWVYVVGYAVIALLGNLIALPLGKRELPVWRTDKIPLGTKGRTSILSIESSASCGASFPVSRRKLPDRECCVTSFRQGGYTPLRR